MLVYAPLFLFLLSISVLECIPKSFQRNSELSTYVLMHSLLTHCWHNVSSMWHCDVFLWATIVVGGCVHCRARILTNTTCTWGGKAKKPLDAFSEMKCAWFFFRQLNFVRDVCSDRWCPCMLEEACISFFWDHGSFLLMVLHWLFFLNTFPPVQSSSQGGERSRLIDTSSAQAFCWSLKSLGGQGFFFGGSQHWPGRTVQVLLTIQTHCIGSCVLDSTF